MKVVADIVTLFIGVIVWYMLKPYIGFGGFVVGVVVAYILRPIVNALLGAPVSSADSQSRNEEAQQGESISSSHNEQKGESQNGN